MFVCVRVCAKVHTALLLFVSVLVVAHACMREGEGEGVEVKAGQRPTAGCYMSTFDIDLQFDGTVGLLLHVYGLRCRHGWVYNRVSVSCSPTSIPRTTVAHKSLEARRPAWAPCQET